jgi:hypothetical protein
MVLPSNSRVVPRPDVTAQEIDDGAVLVNLGSGACFELNLVGFEVWKGLGQGRSLPEIRDTLAGRYNVNPEVIGADIKSLIASLAAAGLVQTVPA